jgi:transketolase
MLNEALTAAELLSEAGFSLKVVNLPWLNRVDSKWLAETIGGCETLFTLDNHSQYGGLGDSLLTALMSSTALRAKKLIKFAIEDFPACGTPFEVLTYHRLDGQSLSTRIMHSMR